jgi:hypothetical protein
MGVSDEAKNVITLKFLRAYGSWTTLPVFSKYSEGYGIKCIQAV